MAKKFTKKTIVVKGKSVDVDAEEVVQDNGVPAIRATAVIGATTVVLIHTLAPVDGAHEPLAADHVQTMLDSLRDRAAKQAALNDDLKSQLAAAT